MIFNHFFIHLFVVSTYSIRLYVISSWRQKTVLPGDWETFPPISHQDQLSDSSKFDDKLLGFE